MNRVDEPIRPNGWTHVRCMIGREPRPLRDTVGGYVKIAGFLLYVEFLARTASWVLS